MDEIVVVGTGSEDRTPEIAREMGAVLVHSRWRDDFAAARNVSLRFASARRMPVPDADEVVDGERLRRKSEVANEGAFLVVQRNALLGPSGGLV